MHLVTEHHGQHHVVVPNHKPIETGTLNQLLKRVAEHHGITRDELIDQLEL